MSNQIEHFYVNPSFEEVRNYFPRYYLCCSTHSEKTPIVMADGKDAHMFEFKTIFQTKPFNWTHEDLRA